MPLPHFLALIFGVIALAGVSVWLALHLGLGLGTAAFVALALATILRGLAWR